MKNFLLSLLLIPYFCLAQEVGAQTVEFEIIYNTSQCHYEAHVIVTSSVFNTTTDTWANGGQFTVVLPSSVSDIPLTITEQVNPTGLSWTNNSSVYAPVDDPLHDFRTFNLLGGGPTNVYPSMAIGTDIHLFSFTLPNNECGNGIRPFINGSDPDSTPGMNGVDYSNGFKTFYSAFVDLYDGNVSDLPLAAEEPTISPSVSCTATDIHLVANATTVCSNSDTYSWTGPDGFTSTDENPIIAIYDPVLQTGLYSLTVIDEKGCSATDAIMVDDLNCFPAVACGPLVINNNNGSSIAPTLYKGTTIDSDGYVAPNTNVDFEAEVDIDLTHPFEVAPGATFSAEIVPCSSGGN